MNKAKRVVIIGAGFGGLSVAIRLAAQGWKVDVYEQQSYAGGKAGSLKLGGYRFDRGPSLITMREVFAELFESVGRRLEDYVQFEQLDTVCSYFFSDGTELASRGNPEDFAREVAAKTDDSAESVRCFLKYSRGIYKKTAELFLMHSLHDWATYFKPQVWKGLLSRGKLDARRSMDTAIRSFFQDPRMRQFFNRYATYNGSDPYQVPATLNIIPHVEYNMGAYASKTGIYALPQAMRSLAEELGVEFHFEQPVEKISVQNGRATGVVTASGEVSADIVLSNIDARRTYEVLLQDPEAPYAQRYRQLEASSSGLVFFWGMKSSYPELTVNNIFFSRDYPAEFKSLFSELRCPDDPTVYVNITSKLAPGDAPEGGENWFVLVNAPRNSGQDWASETARTRERVLARLEQALGRSVANDIAVEEVLTPAHIEEETGSYYGSLYGISSNSKTAAFLRHPARSRRYGGLYFCGGSVHPGGGMPLAVLSGKIAADIIKKKE
ncbi:MAG: phytoene desaturase [Spirochaetia bacterium]|nr:phytoene desaturase [Spirochaetia bacterium]